MKQQEQAFVQLITRHQGIIHKVCGMYCNQDEERRDLFQDIVLQLWRAYESFKGESKISTWMYRVALNTAISGFRKQKRKPEQSRLSDRAYEVPIVLPDPDMEEKRTFLYKAIDQLSEVEKGIVMLHLEDHSYEEIAEIIGITPNYVGVKLNRIKQRLKKILQPHFV
ncbi:MAG: sigma-70 family RNA polymerase sigma factor [Bacteroidota bacterium]